MQLGEPTRRRIEGRVTFRLIAVSIVYNVDAAAGYWRMISLISF